MVKIHVSIQGGGVMDGGGRCRVGWGVYLRLRMGEVDVGIVEGGGGMLGMGEVDVGMVGERGGEKIKINHSSSLLLNKNIGE